MENIEMLQQITAQPSWINSMYYEDLLILSFPQIKSYAPVYRVILNQTVINWPHLELQDSKTAEKLIMSGEERNHTTDKILYKRNNILKDTIRGCSWESAENILKYTENVCKHSPVWILNIRFEQNIRSDTSRDVTDVLQSAYHLN